jgi:outer membrane protein, multidrug efflux system
VTPQRQFQGLCIAASITFAGCATYPQQSVAPQIELPNTWNAAATIEGAPEAWLKDLNSPDLEVLIEEALVNNPNLQRTAAQFDQSIAEARIAGADQLPSAGLGLNGTRQKISTFGPSNTGGVRFDNYDLALNLSWELDLWGQLRDRSSAALAQVEASEAELRGARLSLAANVAKSWFNYIEAQEQLYLSQKTAEADQANLQTIEQRFKRGLSEGLELRQMRTQTAFADADITTRRRALDQATRSLEVLIGRYPKSELITKSTLPPLPKNIPAGLPADLLSRRPDLIAAERRLAAAEKELNASRKDRLPKISLTTSAGTSSQEFNNLLDSDFSAWKLGANLTQPIFQGGRINANIDRSQAILEQSIAQYRSTALQAFLEVETTLAAERFLQDQQRQLLIAEQEAAEAEALAWQRYREGTADFVNVLNSQRSAASARSRLIALRNLLLQNRIDLYLALGGPFENAS